MQRRGLLGLLEPHRNFGNAAVYAMVGDVAPAGTETEAFAWLSTAVAVGAAAGAAAAGVLVDTSGPTATFAVAGAAGLAAVGVGVARRQTLPARTSGPVSVAPACALVTADA